MQQTTTDLHYESTSIRHGSASQADTAGAALIAIGIVGAFAWAWAFVRAAFVVDERSSLGGRIDLLVEQAPILLLSGAVIGLGIRLRMVASTRTGVPTRSMFGRPVGRMLFVVAVTPIALVGFAVMVAERNSVESDSGSSRVIELSSDDFPALRVPTATDPDDADDPPAPTHTIEVHSDGCGVVRSGAIGDDLTWVVKDQDGFQVLGRNAAGETQYRYFRSGTYTVVLEAWGGDFYIEVSNEVTIDC